MSQINCTRSGCKDVFNSFFVADATYAGTFEFPIINGSKKIPNALIPFSKCISSSNYNYWVHFYEDDFSFERIWKNPRKYLEKIKRFNGVILPDFSLYRDMPLVMQLWNIYRSRAIGNWLQNNGVSVIPNLRFGDERTYRICCDGINHNSVIAVGSHGNIKNVTDRNIFLNGLDEVVKILKPKAIIVYGTASEKYFKKYKDLGITIVHFESDYSISHKGVV